MRSTLIILVLVIKFICCAHIGLSENDQHQNVEKNKDLERFETSKAVLPNPDAFPIRKGSVGTTEKQFFRNLLNPYNQVTSSVREKRCSRLRSEFYEKPLGSPKKFLKTSLKEIVGAKQKKRCETCRESARCKTYGKCDLCNRYCKDLDTTTWPSPTEAPLVGSIQVYLEDKSLAPEHATEDATHFGRSGRYYTMGAFGPGPKQNLIVRLMNVARKNSLDKLVVLAKSKGKTENENPEHPIIIDTANAFQSGNGNKKIHAEVHALDGNNLPRGIDFELTSKIDRELDMAIAEKQKKFGKSYLTGKEIDKIIDRALSAVSSPRQENLKDDVVQFGSRMSEINTPHITTKRSVSNWPLTNEDEDALVGLRFPVGKLQQDIPDHVEYGETEEQNLVMPSNKKNTMKSQNKNHNQFLNNIIDKSNRRTNYKGDSYIAEDDCADNVSRMDSTEVVDDSSEVGQDLQEYEPAPPTYLDDINQPRTKPVYEESESRNVIPNHSLSISQTVPDKQSQQKAPNVLNVPILNKQQLESASQYLEHSEYHPQNNSKNIPLQQEELTPSETISGRDNIYGGAAGVLDENTVNDADVIVTLTQAPELYDSNNTQYTDRGNNSDPILGKTWVSDELDKAKMWWSNNVGMETPHEPNSVIVPANIDTNQTDERLQVAESKINFLNASHFTFILKNLEQKVENIADLVKKTCGKLQPENENVGAKEPVFAKHYQEETPVPNSTHSEPMMEQALARNQFQIIEVPENDTANSEFFTPYSDKQNITSDPSFHQPPQILDTALNRLNEGSNFLINKAVDIAEKIKNFAPQRVQNKPLLQAVAVDDRDVSAANLKQKSYSKDGVLVGCSKEDSGEYLGEAHGEKNKGGEEDPTVACSKEESEEYVGEKNKNSEDALQTRSAFDSEAKSPSKKTNLEQDVGCSKEDSEEYLGQQPQNQPATQILNKKGITKVQSPDGENVACSKESDEYVGNSAQKKESVSKIPKKKNYLNILSSKSSHTNTKKPNQDNSIADSQIVNQEVAKAPQKDEEVGCSKEESEEYVGDTRTDNSGKATAGNEEAVGCSKEKEEEYDVPVYPYGSNTYRESNSKPKSSDKPKLPHLPIFDKLLHRNALPPHTREKESFLLKPVRKLSKTSLPKLSRMPNRNRDTNDPSSPQQANSPKVFSSVPQEQFSNIPSDNQRLHPEPDKSEIAQNMEQPPKSSRIPSNSHSSQQPNVPETYEVANYEVDQPRKSSIIPSNSQSPQQPNAPEPYEVVNYQVDQPRKSRIIPSNSHRPQEPNVPEPYEVVNYQADPSRQQQEVEADSPLNDDVHILSPSAPTRQHTNKLLVPPALTQRFGEQGRVDPDGFHVHRPMNLQDWPQLSSKDDVLGARKENTDANHAEPRASSVKDPQNPFSIFGKVVPQLNNTEISFHHVPNNKIYFLGTGMQLPLNMKKDEDGTYQLSVDIDKLCNNCKGSICYKKANVDADPINNKPYLADETNKEVVGMPPPSSTGTQEANRNSTTARRLKPESEGEQHSAFRGENVNQVDESAFERKSPHKIEIVSLEMPRGEPSDRRTALESEHSTEAELFKRKERNGVKTHKKLKYRPLFDTDTESERKHSKRSPSLNINLPSLRNSEEAGNKKVSGRKNEASPRNSVDLDNLDESLKQIDNNMKRYFDRRQKLDDYYKEQVRRNLEQPDDKKDIVKRRVTLVNNVLTWMKNLAVQDPQT